MNTEYPKLEYQMAEFNTLLMNLRDSVRAMGSGTPSVLYTIQGPTDLVKGLYKP